MTRIRAWIIRLLQGEAPTVPPDSDGETREEHPDRQEPRLCPSCIWIRDDQGQVVEVIDCRTLNHHKLEKP